MYDHPSEVMNIYIHQNSGIGEYLKEIVVIEIYEPIRSTTDNG